MWELVSVRDGNTYRMRVPGGWLIKVRDRAGEGIAVCFYPDPANLWKLN